MEVDNNNHSQINSNMKKAIGTKIMYLNKKRKFQQEQLGLPLPKHKCLETMLSFECNSPLNHQGPENDSFRTGMTYKDTGHTRTSDNVSGFQSGEDSNSYIIDSDSATSVFGEAKSPKTCFEKASTSYDQPSTSYGNIGISSFQNAVYSLDSRNEANDKMQENCQAEDQFLEFEDLIDYSVYANELIEQFNDDDNGGDQSPEKFILSSGRWSVHQDNTQVGSKKPTIDQEFEQYFSSLMLQ